MLLSFYTSVYSNYVLAHSVCTQHSFHYIRQMAVRPRKAHEDRKEDTSSARDPAKLVAQIRCRSVVLAFRAKVSHDGG